jgi:hypothetical protein
VVRFIRAAFQHHKATYFTETGPNFWRNDLKKGRISAAALSVVTPLPTGRPAPPQDLSETERDEWRALAGAMPQGWFVRETHPALAALCRHTCRSRVVGAQISKIEAKAIKVAEGVRVLDKLCAMLERETRMVAALSRALRLTRENLDPLSFQHEPRSVVFAIAFFFENAPECHDGGFLQ